MGAVRNPTFALAWLAATTAAVAVSWLGVRTVVHDAVLSPPQLAVPASPVGTGTPPPVPPSTTPVPTTTSVGPTSVTTTPPPTTTTTTTAPPTSSNVHSYAVRGGQVVLSLGATSATLVSATPANGFAVQVWQETGWLRVDFSAPSGTSSVFATWNGHPPSVQTFES
jgi:hypothetical protein